MVKVQRCAMVDEVELSMPQQQIGILRRTVHVLGEGVEPHPSEASAAGAESRAAGSNIVDPGR